MAGWPPHKDIDIQVKYVYWANDFTGAEENAMQYSVKQRNNVVQLGAVELKLNGHYRLSTDSR